MKNPFKIKCVCVLMSRRSVLTLCQDSKIVMLFIQNPNTLEHLRKIQYSKTVTEFTIKLILKNTRKLVNNRLIK